MTIYIIAIQLVFGGIDEVYAFSNEEAADVMVLDWANENSPDGKKFTSAEEALEWFRLHDEEVDYTIQKFENEINISKHREIEE